MKTKFNEFLNESVERIEKAKQWLIKHPFIIEDENTKELKVVALSYYNFPECITKLNSRKFIGLEYNTLVRYLLFAWLYKYDGDNEMLVKMKKIYMTKQYKKHDSFTRPFTQIPTNYTLLNTHIKPIIGHTTTKSKDPLILATLLFKKDELFTEENIVSWYNTVAGITEYADKSEEKTIKLIKDNKLFDDAETAKGFDDKIGIDVWGYKNGEKIPIQVKQPAKDVDINMYWSKKSTWKNRNGQEHAKFIIVIKKTNLDLGEYFVGTDGKLHWKFLFLWDNKRNKVYQINSHSIESINKDKNDNVWINMKLDKEWLPKMIKTYNI